MKGSPGPRSSSTLPSLSARRQFALTGPSARLDPATHAVRGDLADVRLADRVFAPHYAQAMPCLVCCATPLLRSPAGEPVATLAKDDVFELLELAGNHAWGVAQAAGLVGYCDRQALELA